MFTIRKSLVAALVAGAAFAPSALAQGGPGGGGGAGGGGGGGGAAPAPPKTFPAAVCSGANPVGNVSWIPLAAGNCLTIQSDANGAFTVAGVTAGPGYTFNVKKDGANDIDVVFSNGNPAQQHEYRRSGNGVRVS